MKAAIIAVGTELTTGQILNHNASWISEQLKTIGILTSLHLTIPDDRKLILDSLNFAASRAELLFITGGLGPTSDDFTRELVSEWSQSELQFDQASWDHINESLRARNYPVREIQKQQCYFPKGAQILKNSEGTANGFIIKKANIIVFALPGPPREIAALFKDYVSDEVQTLTRNLDRHITLSWECIGYGESQIAEIAEPLIKDSGFEIGYRVHMPYVEVKFSFFESKKPKAQIYIDQLNSALSPLTLLPDGRNLLNSLIEELTKYPRIEIYDSLTGNILAQRCFLPAQKLLKDHQWLFSSGTTTSLELSKQTPEALKISLKRISNTKALAEIQFGQVSQEQEIESQSSLPERQLQVFTEYAMLFWYQKLKSRK